MRSLNRCTFIGNLGADPEVLREKDKGLFVRISVATSESWIDEDGEEQTDTQWHTVYFNNKLAEIALTYLKKGHRVYVEGKLRHIRWTDEKTQVKRTSSGVYASAVLNLTPSTTKVPTDAALAGAEPETTKRAATAARTVSESSAEMPSDYEDDIPF